MRSNKSLTVSVLIALVGVGLIGCTEKESHEPVVMMAAGLDTVKENWVKQGCPKDFQPSNAFHSSVERFYVFTNEISVAGKFYHCRFAVRSQLIHTPGAMAITDEGVLLWIRDKDGKVTISPEKNGIEMADRD